MTLAKAPWLVPLIPVWLCLFGPAASALPLPEHAARMGDDLRQKILPYWLRTTLDEKNGGYVLADDQKGRRVATEKQIVTQARLVWGFSHAHFKGFSDPKHDYLRAATHGYHFLMAHFQDRENGGYFWKTDLRGGAINDRKLLYGQAFVIYALVEFHRASREKEPLQKALELYDLLETRAHDSKNKGWGEHFRRDWTPILQPENGSEVEVPGLKSANAHLHWMEALTELYEATHEARVEKSLIEALELNVKYFYPKEPGKSAFHRQFDWSDVTNAASAGLSYGHNVEFAWLMIRAERVLGRRPSWNHFGAHLRHALRYGFDHDRGGLYERGVDDSPATKTDKVWWVQAEMLAALTVALEHRPNIGQAEALAKLLHFVAAYQTDPADGIWIDTVAADGKPKNTAKANNWKANYHDVRAMMKFVEAFGPRKK